MPTLLWIALGLALWTSCGVLAIAIGCAARRGDHLSQPALLGTDPSLTVPQRRRIIVDVHPVVRPWATVGAGAPAAVSALVEAGGPAA